MMKEDLSLYNSFLNILHGENDRGAVLSASAFLEQSLEKILRAFLADVPTTDQLLYGFNAPAGTLGGKAKLTYSLGLLDKDLFSTIEIIRKIRNEFAHNWQGVSFDGNKVKALLNSFPPHPLNRLHMNESKVGNIRDQFDNTVACCLLELNLIPKILKSEKRIPKRLIRFEGPYSTLEEASQQLGRSENESQYL